ncbi:FxsA family protein [Sulfurovum sp.]|uniref:FxsA family protein n=1 Tax=Sulfurovum sp. TaxID=1969726 RepID=UPI0025EBC829|nr:FxsA family protein [Sulfurovum sp.]
MFILIMIPFMLLELYLSLYVGERIGFWWSVIWISVTMVIGIRLLQYTPYTMMGNISQVSLGKLSMQEFQNASTAYLAGAILLIIPGVLTDMLGILALGYATYLRFVAKITPEHTKFNQNKGDDNVIDVEIIDERADSDSRIER